MQGLGHFVEHLGQMTQFITTPDLSDAHLEITGRQLNFGRSKLVISNNLAVSEQTLSKRFVAGDLAIEQFLKTVAYILDMTTRNVGLKLFEPLHIRAHGRPPFTHTAVFHLP